MKLKNIKLFILFSIIGNVLFTENITLTIKEAKKLAFENNVQLKNEALRLEITKLNSSMKYKSLLPSVSYSFGYDNTNSSLDNFFTRNNSNFSLNNNLSFSISDVLYNGNILKEYSIQKQIALFRYDISKFQIKTATTRYYVELLKALNNIEAKKRALKQMKDKLSREQELSKIGKSSPLDIAEMRIRVIRLEDEMLALEDIKSCAAKTLSSFIGLDTGYLIKLSPVPEKKLEKMKQPDNLPACQLDLTLSEQIYNAKQKLKKNELSYILPKLDFKLNYSMNLDPKKYGTPTFGSELRKQYSGWGIEFTLQLFNWGIGIEQLKKFRYENCIECNEKEERKKVLEFYARSKFAEIEKLKRSLKVNAETLKYLAIKHKNYEEKYKRGLIELEKLLDLENEIINKELEIFDAKSDLYFSIEDYKTTLKTGIIGELSGSPEEFIEE